jgi:predicted dehydrogenase
VSLRVGLIGCGNWGRHVLRDLVSLGAEVHVATPSPRSRATAEQGGAVRVVDRLEALETLEGYVVASPSVTHADVIDALLPTGRPIFVEKPMTVDVASAKRLAATAGERIFVMEKWRYHAGIEALAAMAKSGELGRVLAIRTERVGWGNPHEDVDAGWILLPHDLSIAYEILGHLPAARAAWSPTGRPHCDLIATLGDAGGPAVTMEIGISHPVTRRSVLVVGTERSAQLGGSYDDRISIAEGNPAGVRGAPYHQPVAGEMPLLRELRAFLDHLRGGPPPRSSAAEGMLVVERVAALRALAGLAD